MFGNAEEFVSHFTGSSQTELEELLKFFSQEVREMASRLRLPIGQMPFVKIANFTVFVFEQEIVLVVDDSPSGTIPTHQYFKIRNVTPPPPTIEEIAILTVRQYNYQLPKCVRFPRYIITADNNVKKDVFKPIVAQICQEQVEKEKMRNLNLPAGFEHYLRLFPQFLHDNPNIERNIFLMMRFKETRHFEEIHRAIRETLEPMGLNVLRADTKEYTDDLWDNVTLYMLGCSYGIAVFEEIDQREFNPNVALELGFMRALNKRCLILKDSRMPRVPTDIIGKLYKEFDSYEITSTIERALGTWTRDLNLR